MPAAGTPESQASPTDTFNSVLDVLWLSVETPDVNGGGGQRRQFHQISALVKAGVTVAVATLDGPQDDSAIRSVTVVHRFVAQRRLGRQSGRGLERVLEEERPRRAIVAHVESFPSVGGDLRRAGIPFLIDFHNVVSRWHKSVGANRSAAGWRAREENALTAATRATACSFEERAELVALGTPTFVDVSPHGVSLGEWPASALSSTREPALAMFGSWQHKPNALAAEWLVHEVWPIVRRAVPDSRLVLLGPGEAPRRVLGVEGVENRGRVEDLAGALGRIRVVGVPIQRGIGSRVKFIESLASGAAVVSTTLGCEGFDSDGGFVEANTPMEFAGACIDLLRNERRAADLGRRGRKIALSRYRWEQVGRPIVRFAQGVITDEESTRVRGA